jgi:hypothetical protein
MAIKKIGLDPQGYETATSNRSVNTVFQNNTGAALHVVIIGEDDNDDNVYALQVGPQSNNLSEVARVDLQTTGTGSVGKRTIGNQSTIEAIVPDGSFYKLDALSNSLNTWSEQELK